jgi:hypothetical protein
MSLNIINKHNNKKSFDSYKENGFVHLRKFLKFNDYIFNKWVLDCFNLIGDISIDTKLDLLTTLSELGRYYKDESKWQEFQDIYVGIFQRNIDIYRLASDPRLIDILNRIGIKNPYLCSDPLLMLNGGEFSRILGESTHSPLHQDWASMQSSQNSVVLWIPLVDVDKDTTGSIKVWSKSQSQGLYKMKSEDWFAEISSSDFIEQVQNSKEINADKGDCIFFSSLLVHKSIKPDNNSTFPRLTIQLRFGDLSCDLLKKNKGVFNYNHCSPNKKPFERPGLVIPKKGWDKP